MQLNIVRVGERFNPEIKKNTNDKVIKYYPQIFLKTQHVDFHENKGHSYLF